MSNFNLVALAVESGKIAVADGNEADAVCFRETEAVNDHLVMMTDCGNHNYYIKPFNSEGFWKVNKNGIVEANGFEPELFSIDFRENSHITLKYSNGKYLACGDDGKLRPLSEAPVLFKLLRFEDLESGLREMKNCCGTSHRHESDRLPKDVKWESLGHARIAEWAKDILLKKRDDFTELEKGFRCFEDEKNFWDIVLQGLEEADTKQPYVGFFWSSHFYDPYWEWNYLGQKKGTAMTECQKAFLTSVFAMRAKEPDYRTAAYQLGIALHYFTDLTQPMHAANFINIPKLDMRHAAFEEEMDKALKREPDKYKIAPGTVKIEEEIKNPLKEQHNIRGIIQATAEVSKQTFYDQVTVALSVPSVVEYQRRIFDTSEVGARSLPIFPEITRNAQLATARFLAYWAQSIESFNLLDFVSKTLKQGHQGAWTLSAAGLDGTWRRGDKYGHRARVINLDPSILEISGEFCAIGWNNAEVIPITLKIYQDSDTEKWFVYFKERDNIEMTRELEPPQTWQDVIHFKVAGQGEPGYYGVLIRPLYSNPSWYPGVQFDISLAEEIRRYICFEDMSQGTKSSLG